MTFSSGALSFALNGVPGYNEWNTLFDEYRISGIKITFKPNANIVDAGSSGGTFYYLVDRNDAIPPASEQEMLEWQGVRSFLPSVGQFRKIFFKPNVKTALAANSTDSTVALVGLKYSPWIQLQGVAASQGIVHYGLKWLWGASSAPGSMRIYITYYIHFRNVK